MADASSLGIEVIWAGKSPLGDPTTDTRVPDIIIQSAPGITYTTSTSKCAEHGGFNPDDTHVALMLIHPRFKHTVIADPVDTRQIAVTVLRALGLNPKSLSGVVAEGTLPLPFSF